MGTWNLIGLTGIDTPLNGTPVSPQLFGHNIRVTFRLKYTSSTFGPFTESPSLDWHERFMMKHHHSGQWWEFEHNMFELKPGSKTFESWTGRYFAAYDNAGGVNSLEKGSSKLFNKHGAPVGINDLGRNISGNKEKADAVRAYLKKHGGILEVQVHDIPGINERPNEHNERLLIFNCGLVGGGGMRFRGEQYLDVNAAVPKHSWGRTFKIGGGHTWTTRGLTKIAAPANVSTPGEQVMFPGEYK